MNETLLALLVCFAVSGAIMCGVWIEQKLDPYLRRACDFLMGKS